MELAVSLCSQLVRMPNRYILSGRDGISLVPLIRFAKHKADTDSPL